MVEILNRIFIFIFGTITSVVPIAIIFILYKLTRGKRGKEIFYTGKEFTSKSILNYFLLLLIGIAALSLLFFNLKGSDDDRSQQPNFFGKKYMSKDIEECKLIDFECGRNETIFQDRSGCGCMK